jgi:DsbC/DsbD-like thiol-disulfide interchange protein
MVTARTGSRRTTVWQLVAVLALACGAPAERAAGPEPAPRPAQRRPELVRLTLLADAVRVAPGRPLTLAARLDIAPGWHIYWSNPGDSGLATEATFRAPDGFRVGPARFPGPARFDSPGDITSYGYQELAMLSTVVATPDALTGDRVQFSVQASWLACRDVCVPGRAEAVIELEAARAGEAPQPAHADLFARHAAALPRPLSALGAADPTWRRDERQVAVALVVPAARTLEYFPASDEDMGLTGQATVPAPAGARLELSYKPSVRPVRLGGVLAVTAGAGVRYYALDLEEPTR